MSAKFKPVVFDPYRRRGWRVPRWLVLLLVGVALGAGGLFFAQERYLPRLSVEESATLRRALDQTEAERARLQGELADATKRLDAATAGIKQLKDDLSASRATVETQRDDLAAVVAALPPDPRGGTVEVRAGRFSAARGALAYDVVLTRERGNARPLAGTLQLSVTGEAARGGETTVALKPIEISIGAHAIVRGSVALPEGLKPRQTTVQVLDRSGQQLGMRVMLVR